MSKAVGEGIIGLRSWSSATVKNCLVVGNTSKSAVVHITGGGSYNSVISCTIADNTCSSGTEGAAGIGGAGSTGGGYNTLKLRNNIVIGNMLNGVESNLGTFENTAKTIDHNWCTPGEDPLFVRRAQGDYSLMPGSKCIDAGVNEGWEADGVDLNGNPRLHGKRVDLGAYEGIRAGTLLLLH